MPAKSSLRESIETVVHSDGLDVDKVVELQNNGQELGIGVAFGVGTSKPFACLCSSKSDVLSSPDKRYDAIIMYETCAEYATDFIRVEKPTKQSDFEVGSGPAPTSGEESKALNIVIKLWEIAGRPCVKISDEINKVSFVMSCVALSISCGLVELW